MLLAALPWDSLAGELKVPTDYVDVESALAVAKGGDVITIGAAGTYVFKAGGGAAFTGSLRIRSTVTERDDVVLEGGLSVTGDLTLEHLVFDVGDEGGSVSGRAALDDVRVNGNVRVLYSPDLSLESVDVLDVTMPTADVFYANSVTAHNVRAIRTSAVSLISVTDGGTVDGVEVRCSTLRRVVTTGSSIDISNVLVAGGSGGLVYGSGTVRHATFAGVAPEGILVLGPYTVDDSVFVDADFLFRTTKSNKVTATRSVWYDIDDAFPDGGAPTSGLTELDPMLSTAGDPCSEGYWPKYGSPLVDAGDPGDVDLDGSPADIGASGGSTALDFVPDADEDGVNASRDCDDNDALRRPSSPDAVGDGFDQNCDGIDGTDADGDGWASESSGGTDCADDDSTRNPGQTDVIGDGFDDNCDDLDGVDADGDGHADADLGGDDCDDADETSFPGAGDTVGDGADNNCDGVDGVDVDGDAHANEASGGDDCDDTDAEILPGVPDKVGDSVDTNCDGSDGVDVDADGFAREASGGDDCGDTDPAVHPGATDSFGDSVDQDCDGLDGIDGDGDGHASEASGGDDCADTNPAAFPGATEDKGGDDLDCDGKPSVGCNCASTPTGTSGGALAFLAAALLLRRRR